MADQDDFGDDNNQQGPIVNKNPYLLISAFSSAISFFESYGWYILFGVIIAMVVWTNIRDSLKRFFGQRKRDVSVTDFMTADQVESRMRSMDAARLRMQEKYDRLVQEKAEKLKEREEEKRRKLIEDHEALKQGKSQSGTLNKMEIKSTTAQPPPTVIKRDKDAQPMRSEDFNPLGGGSSTSPRFRPGPRSPRSG